MWRSLKIDGEGGMIGVDADGNASLILNSKGCIRDFVRVMEREVLIYK
jgi:isoaspartyl peptidase/L-asparaginase-like protein (Ntn-hydrolase superfamily)